MQASAPAGASYNITSFLDSRSTGVGKPPSLPTIFAVSYVSKAGPEPVVLTRVVKIATCPRLQSPLVSFT